MNNHTSTAVNNKTFRHFTDPKEHLRIVKPILYRRQEVDLGLPLTEVKGRWELKNWRKPCWAKSLTSGNYITELSPHKKNLTVYISFVDIKVGDEILVLKNDKYSKMLITKKVDKTIGFKLLESWDRVVKTVDWTPKNSTVEA